MPASPPATRRFYGYTIVAASFFMQAVSVGSMISYSVFFRHLLDEFGWSRAFVSGASSMVMFTMGALGMVFGRLNDRFGPRRILLLSGLRLAGGFMLMSVLQTRWQLYVFYGLLVGIGMSTHDIVTLSTIARWFRRRRGMMTGLVKAGTGTGQFIIPLMVSALIVTAGWRSTYLVIGVMVLVVYPWQPASYGGLRGDGTVSRRRSRRVEHTAQTRDGARTGLETPSLALLSLVFLRGIRRDGPSQHFACTHPIRACTRSAAAVCPPSGFSVSPAESPWARVDRHRQPPVLPRMFRHTHRRATMAELPQAAGCC
jgi:MFS family permease